jgi:hypothetical protein
MTFKEIDQKCLHGALLLLIVNVLTLNTDVGNQVFDSLASGAKVSLLS